MARVSAHGSFTRRISLNPHRHHRDLRAWRDRDSPLHARLSGVRAAARLDGVLLPLVRLPTAMTASIINQGPGSGRTPDVRSALAADAAVMNSMTYIPFNSNDVSIGSRRSRKQRHNRRV